MNGVIETFFNCPYCFEEISMLLEPLDERQNYIEDCEVCCQPINIDFLYKQEQIENLIVTPINN